MGGRFEALRSAVSADSPSGIDLEYDPDFAAMEKASQGTPDQEYGSTRIEGEPPDWLTVSRTAQSLLTRTRDLRIGTYLAQAELVLNGVTGMRDALELMAVWLEQFWDTVYPQLDADDDNDPTIRVNSLMGLSNVGGMIRQLRTAPILISRSVGKFSWTDCAIAKGELPVPTNLENPPTQKMIDAAVETSSPEQLQELADAVTESITAINRIEQVFSTNLDAASGPNLELLSKELKNIARFQKLWLDQIKPAASAPPPASVAIEPAPSVEGSLITVSPGVAAHSPVHPQVVGAASFIITRREDAIEGLDKIIGWFEQFEPSSPLPMLLKRAKRLSTMSFLEILRDISPDGIEQALLIGGRAEEEEEEVTSAPSAAASSSPPPQRRVVDEDY